jgi:hypothetical protein
MSQINPLKLNKFRKLVIKYSLDRIEKKNKIKILIKGYKKELDEHHVKIKFIENKQRDELFSVELFGYDGTLKYKTNKINCIEYIIELIDKMPMGDEELTERIKSIEIYTNAHKGNTIKGLGYKNKEVALKSIELVKSYSKEKQFRIINILYQRAKYHPYPTSEIKDAMKVFKKWLDGYYLRA